MLYKSRYDISQPNKKYVAGQIIRQKDWQNPVDLTEVENPDIYFIIVKTNPYGAIVDEIRYKSLDIYPFDYIREYSIGFIEYDTLNEGTLLSGEEEVKIRKIYKELLNEKTNSSD